MNKNSWYVIMKVNVFLTLTILIILNLFSEHCHFSAYGWNRTNCFRSFKLQPLKHPVLWNDPNFWSWIKFSSFLPASIFFGLTTCKRLKNTHFFFSLFHNLFFHLIFLNPTPSKLEEGDTTERRIKCGRRGKAYIWLFLHIFKIFMIFLILQILKANYLTCWALWWVFGRILCRVPCSKTPETWAGPLLCQVYLHA